MSGCVSFEKERILFSAGIGKDTLGHLNKASPSDSDVMLRVGKVLEIEQVSSVNWVGGSVNNVTKVKF